MAITVVPVIRTAPTLKKTAFPISHSSARQGGEHPEYFEDESNGSLHDVDLFAGQSKRRKPKLVNE